MPVHEIRYKPWEGELKPELLRLLAVPKYTLMSVWSKWLAIALFGGSLLPVVCFTGYVLIVSNPAVREILEITNFVDFPIPVLFERMLWIQMFCATMVALVAAPRMIASELANRALPLVYSRPISRPAYILGKFSGLFAVLSLPTWVQTVVIWTTMAILYPDTHFFHVEFGSTSLPVLLATAALGLLGATVLSLVALASSATKNPRFGAVGFFVLLAGGSFFTNFIQEAGWRDFPNIGVREIFYWLGAIWIGTDQVDRFGTAELLAALSLWIGGALAYLLWKLRPVDVYGD